MNAHMVFWESGVTYFWNFLDDADKFENIIRAGKHPQLYVVDQICIK